MQQVLAGASTGYLHEPGAVTITDPAAKVVKQSQDGLGRLKSVVEAGDAANGTTTYTYDAANRLTGVSQGVQTRSFVYDWAGQLLSATNPENGAMQYQYDAAGNFIAKIDARSAVVCAGAWNGSVCDGSGVDGLGRTVKKTYVTPSGVGATQAVVYCFDGRKTARLTGPDRVECTGTGDSQRTRIVDRRRERSEPHRL